ncbi:MAG: beta strand repeat-containing protein, partial [Bacteroidia bacterium]
MTICTLLRRKRSFLALFITAMLTFSSSVKAQTWNLAEPTDGSGATGTDVGRGICTDASGNVYIVGVFNGTGDFDLNSATTSTYTSAGNDGFVASYDKNGSFRWRTIISGTGSDFIAPAGGICTDGTSVWFTGNVNMSGAPQVISGSNTVTVTSTGGAAADVIVGKLACSNGAVNWAVEFGGAGSNDGGEGICVDPSGCCYVVGSYGGTFTLNGHTAATSGGSSDLFIAKFNPGGGMVRLATGGSTTGADMISGGAGICYVPGGTPAIVAGGSMAAGTGTYGSFNYTSTGGIDAMLLELDTTLNFTNAIGLGTGVASTDEILGVTYDPFSGGVYIAGYYNGGSITLPGTATMTNAGVQDIMVASYSVAANNFTWASHAGGTGDDRGQSITADGQGGILVSGNTGSIPCTFSGSVSVSSSSAGLNDLYVARYNTSGTPIWASVAGEATGDEQARGVASYVQSAPYVQNVFTTGNFQNSATFGVTTLIADGGSDYFLARINDLSTPLSATQSQVNLTCNGVCTGSATVVASGGTAPYTYSWSPSGGSGATASSLCATNYTVTITDAASTSITKTFNITQPPAITSSVVSQTNVACNGGTTGAATITASGGTGTLTYNWNPGNPTGDGTVSVTGLSALTWTCTVTDANSCTKTQTVTITQPPALVASPVSQTNVACNGGTNGSATVSASGGTPGYTYSWAPSGGTGATASGLAANTYTVTVTDANSCTATRTFTITAPPAITTTAVSQTNVSCFGGSNGAATISVSGGTPGYTYDWTPGTPTGDGTASVTGLTAQAWTCTVTDANGCTATRPFTITAPSAIATTAVSQTNVSCNGGTNGSATVSASGGTPGYTYSWAPSGGTAATASGLSANTYTVTVTDANGCTATRPFTITAPSAIVTTAVSQTNVSCNGGTNGSATVSASGGTPG